MIVAATLGICAVLMFGAMPFFGHVSLSYAFVATLLVCGSLGAFALSLVQRRSPSISSSPSAKQARTLVVAAGALWSVVAVVAALVTIVLSISKAAAHPSAPTWMELAFAVLLLLGAAGWLVAYRRTAGR
jgi:hypothetical protein